MKPVIFYCNRHKDYFEQTPFAHLHSLGCPICVPRQYSKKAIKWLDELSKLWNISIKHAENGGEYHIPNTRYSVDGFCEETSVLKNLSVFVNTFSNIGIA